MAQDPAHQSRRPTPDSEKITINLGYVDLGQIDLLVKEGFYSNRTDLIRTAIRNQLERHAQPLQTSMQRQSAELGLRTYTRAELDTAKTSGLMLDICVVGLAVISADVPIELARSTIRSIHVLGAFHATPAMKAALADRMRS